MGLLTVKLRRDLRATWPRLALMVVAVAVSLAVFGGVVMAWSAIDRETRRAYLTTEPASATIRFGPGVDAQQMAEIVADVNQRPGVIAAAGRTQFTTDVTVNGSAREIGIQVFVAPPDDDLRMAKFFPTPDWPAAGGEILIRQDSLSLLDTAVGDTITIKSPGTMEQPRRDPLRLRVGGTVYDPGLAPAGQQQIAQGYLSTTTLATLGEPDVLDQLKIQIADPGQATPSRSRETIVAVAGDVAEWLRTEYGLSIREIQVPKPYAHPHQGQADALLSALLAGAAAALVLSAILVATILNNLFTQQIPHIGIMKAIGAGSGRIGLFYLAMTLMVAAMATLIAVPAAIVIGRGFTPAVLSFLGIEPNSVAAPWWTYLVVVAAGLALPMAMALVPLIKTARTTVRAAIDHHGGTDRPGTASGLVARLSRVRGLDRGLLMALRNTVRRPARFLLSVGLLAGAGTMFVAGMSARDGTATVAAEASAQLKWDVVVQLANPTTVDTLKPLIERMPGVEWAEGWTTTSAGVAGPGRLPLSRTYPDQGHGGVFVTAIPTGTTMQSTPTLRDGRWLKPGETGAIVLSQITLANTDYDVQAGDTIELYVDGESTRWRLVGIVEEKGETGGAYVTAKGLATAMEQPLWSNTLRIATDRHDEKTRQAVATAADKALTAAGVEVTAAESVGKKEAATGGHLDPILVILLATALPLGVIGLIGLASTMSANILDRTREFGVMHAIGARPKAVRRIVVAEGVFIALTSCVLAILPALGLTAGLGALLGDLFFNAPLPFRVSLLSVAIWTALVVLGAILATDAAANRASRIPVREALAYL